MPIEQLLTDLTAEMKRGNDIAAERNRLQAALLESMKQGPNDETRAMFTSLRDAIYSLTAIERTPAQQEQKAKRSRKAKQPEAQPDATDPVAKAQTEQPIADEAPESESQDTQGATEEPVESEQPAQVGQIAEADLPTTGTAMAKVQVPLAEPVPEAVAEQPAANAPLDYAKDIVPLCRELLAANSDAFTPLVQYFGVKNLKDVPPARWHEVKAKLEEAIAKKAA